ncbi:MAG TPA: hypothetical protein VK791_11195 [bacterium]|nr:hypothetical protein [bacterium]
MSWKKLGFIFKPSGNSSWMKTHAAVPFADHIKGDIFKIYFTSRNSKNYSHLASLKINLNSPTKIYDLSQKPLLKPGEPGTFDENGAMLSWIVHNKKKSYFYYIGWNLGLTIPFRNSMGLAAQLNSSQKITKSFKGPIMDRDINDSCFVTNPCVLKEKDHWKMWYLSCIKWKKISTGFMHHYYIKYAESKDGISWDRKNLVSIDFKNKSEYAISRPSVLKENGIYKMWFSYRGKFYQIGYAESKDGKKWTRMDQKAGLSVSPSGWDSKMVEYPHVFDHKGKRYMLYNGNGYGKTGFGIAVWEPTQ